MTEYLLAHSQTRLLSEDLISSGVASAILLRESAIANKLIKKGLGSWILNPSNWLHRLATWNMEVMNADDRQLCQTVMENYGEYMHEPDEDGMMPIHIAASGGHLSTFKFFLEKGGLKNLHLLNKSGKTPIDCAQESKSTAILHHIAEIFNLKSWSLGFPEEIFVEIFKHLTPTELNNVAPVCRTFYRLSWSPKVCDHVISNSKNLNLKRQVRTQAQQNLIFSEISPKFWRSDEDDQIQPKRVFNAVLIGLHNDLFYSIRGKQTQSMSKEGNQVFFKLNSS
eukprot:TRINITY_DN3543_c0_g1_i2.p1 TRINITY_DN3543_c0_g1~~TRINITY_DN3543_c0_g1_i2.p1  ORF type:complete len:281 (+),score=81.75 TRINITY_DN3543_c0_g1_i2:203-1045(+)